MLDAQVIARLTTQLARILEISEEDLLQHHSILRVERKGRGMIYQVNPA